MAGAGRRRRFLNRAARIRRRTWSKQRGAKLRSSSSSSGSDGNQPDPVIKPVFPHGDAASKLALKMGVGGGSRTCSPKSTSGGDDVCQNDDDGSYGLNTGTTGCEGSPKHIVEVGGNNDDVSFSPVLGCCGCDLNRKHLVAEEGGCEGACALKLGICNCDGSLEHGRNVREHRIRRSRLRADTDEQLYVLDSEAKDDDLEESSHPVLRRGQGALGRQLTANDEATMELWLTGIEEADREVFIPWIKVALASI